MDVYFFIFLIPDACIHDLNQTGSYLHQNTMEAIAKYDFKATADDELSFKRGEVLKVNTVFVLCLCT